MVIYTRFFEAYLSIYIYEAEEAINEKELCYPGFAKWNS
ncbi:hypothetical protein NIES4071_45330 [Calothrix sp. NIES-4071]|nr:hypothetical protein NIES4071_45330 [Calothrix sp. NIES-4071]BAZ58846.1 hypothetical protein NIES4105_45260 [Calothrix sp. NIES-4105]